MFLVIKMYKERLKKLREDKNITQSTLANYLNIHEYVYGQYEREYTIMPIKHLNSLSNYFEVSLDYLLGLTNSKNHANGTSDISRDLSSTRLKEFRKENKITQDKLAKILNVSRTTITEYERMTNIIATPFLYEICKKYKISADYLLGKVDEPKYLK